MRALGVKATKGGRQAEFFTTELPITGLKRTLEVGFDRNVTVTKDALEALLGSAYPRSRNSEQDAVLSAATSSRRGGAIAQEASAGSSEMVALPVDKPAIGSRADNHFTDQTWTDQNKAVEMARVSFEAMIDYRVRVRDISAYEAARIKQRWAEIEPSVRIFATARTKVAKERWRGMYYAPQVTFTRDDQAEAGPHLRCLLSGGVAPEAAVFAGVAASYFDLSPKRSHHLHPERRGRRLGDLLSGRNWRTRRKSDDAILHFHLELAQVRDQAFDASMLFEKSLACFMNFFNDRILDHCCPSISSGGVQTNGGS